MSEIKIDVVELQKINLEPGDVLSVKLVGDDFDESTTNSLKSMLDRVFTKNKVMVFTMPSKSDIVFEAIKSPSSDCSTGSYCDDCSCGKKQQILGDSNE